MARSWHTDRPSIDDLSALVHYQWLGNREAMRPDMPIGLQEDQRTVWELACYMHMTDVASYDMLRPMTGGIASVMEGVRFSVWSAGPVGSGYVLNLLTMNSWDYQSLASSEPGFVDMQSAEGLYWRVTNDRADRAEEYERAMSPGGVWEWGWAWVKEYLSNGYDEVAATRDTVPAALQDTVGQAIPLVVSDLEADIEAAGMAAAGIGAGALLLGAAAAWAMTR